MYFVFVVAMNGWPARQSLVSSNPLAAFLTVTAAAVSTVTFGKVIGRLALPGGRLWYFFETSTNTPAMKRSVRVDPTQPLSDEERRLAAGAPTAFTVFMVEIASYEAIALYGIVLAFIARNPMAVVPFGLASFLLIWTVPSNLDQFFDRARNTLPT